MKPLLIPALLALLFHGFLLSRGGNLFISDRVQEPKPLSLSLSLIHEPAPAKPDPPVTRVEEPLKVEEPPKPVAPEKTAEPIVEVKEEEKRKEAPPEKGQPASPPKKRKAVEPQPVVRPKETVREKKGIEPSKKTEKEKTLDAPSRDETIDRNAGPGPFMELAEKAEEIYQAVLPKGTGAETVKEAVPIYRSNPTPPYPLIARRRGYEGTVILEVLVNPKGRVEDLKIFRSSDHPVLDDAAVTSVRHWLFEPAKRGDRKIEMWVKVPICFRLK